jgi:hypothetical protein
MSCLFEINFRLNHNICIIGDFVLDWTSVILHQDTKYLNICLVCITFHLLTTQWEMSSCSILLIIASVFLTNHYSLYSSKDIQTLHLSYRFPLFLIFWCFSHLFLFYEFFQSPGCCLWNWHLCWVWWIQSQAYDWRQVLLDHLNVYVRTLVFYYVSLI